MEKGHIVLALHSHLPWAINHGKWPHGEDWLTEAICETYIPLLNSLNRLVDEGISPCITIDFSSVLLEMLSHSKVEKIFLDYVDTKIKWAVQDEKEFRSKGELHLEYMAKWWQKWYSDKKNAFLNKYDSDIIAAFRTLQHDGHIEITACSATHGYAPLLADDRSVNLQIELAAQNYQKHFHTNPKGIWLAECGYRPSYTWNSAIPVTPYNQPHHRAGLEEYLSRYGIRYTFVDQYLIDNAEPLGWYHRGDKQYFVDRDFHKDSYFSKSSLLPFHISSSKNTEPGTAIGLSRNYDLSMKIWSAKNGYPGHPDYLDFHKKKEGGYLRYWRVTELELDMQYKDFYRPEWVEDKLDAQAQQMTSILETAADNFHHHTHRRAVITLPFDTELFGHWWFEGISFLERLIRNINNSNIISMKKGNDAINSNYPSEVVRLPEGSWGENSNHSVWMNDKNKWVWEEIYNSEKKLLDIYSQNDLDSIGATEKRLLNSALKQLILLQASDWGFLIHNSSSQDYAEHRFHSHLSDFNKLIDFFFTSQKSKLGKSEIAELEKIEERDSLFNELDTNMWKTL